MNRRAFLSTFFLVPTAIKLVAGGAPPVTFLASGWNTFDVNASPSILDDVRAMIKTLEADKKFSPYEIIVPYDFELPK